MSDSILNRYIKPSLPAETTSEPGGETTALVRANTRQEIMLNVKLKTTDCYGFPYSYLMAMQFNASGIITLTFSTHVVTVRGQNLRTLYARLLNQSVKEIEENRPPYEEPQEASAFISSIEVKEMQ